MLHIPAREGLWEGPFLWHTFCLLMQKMQSGLLACWWLSSTSPANASHLLPTVIIPFNSIARLQTHCGLTDRKRQRETDVFISSPIQHKTIILIWMLNWCIGYRGCSSLRWPLSQKRRGKQRSKNSSVDWRDTQQFFSQRLSATPCALSGLMGKRN